MCSAKRKLLLIVSFLVFILSPHLSQAKDTGLAGFDIQLFRPPSDGLGLFGVGASEVLPHLTYSLGLYTNFSHGLASVVMPARGTSLSIIDNNMTGDFLGAVGLFNFMDVGIGVPVAFYQDGHDFTDLAKYKTAGLGDMRLDLKFRLLSDKPGSLGTALVSRATFPTGSRKIFTGYNGPSWEGVLILDKSFRPVSLFANVGYRLVKSTKVLSTTFDDRLTFGGGVRVPLPFSDRSWSIIAEATGETVVSDIKEISTPIEVRGGIRKEFKSGLAINFGGGKGVTNAYGSPDYRIFAGISFSQAARHKARQPKASEAAPEKIKYTVYFSFDRADVRRSEYPELRKIGQSLAWNPPLRLIVDGHTDSMGPKDYNIILSRERAQTVKQYLIYFGAGADQIEVGYYGEDKPADTNETAKGRQNNRRVEIYSKSSLR